MELCNEPMAKHTTLRIGGPARKLLIPESEEELLGLLQECRKAKLPFRIVGNGSNILVNDVGLEEVVIKNTRACLRLECHEGAVYAGGSVKIQHFLRFCAAHNLGGLEYLFSVPATIGGAVLHECGTGALCEQTNF